MFTLELAGVHQQNLPTKRQRQARGWLVGIEPVEKIEGDGVVWKCRCEFTRDGQICNEFRDVLARDFRSHRVKRCKKCIKPVFVKQQKLMRRKRKEKERATLLDLGSPWYSDEFKKVWKTLRAAFTTEQRFLYEVIMNGRTHSHYEMQAVQLVILCKDITNELVTFREDRKIRAWQRMKGIKDDSRNKCREISHKSNSDTRNGRGSSKVAA